MDTRIYFKIRFIRNAPKSPSCRIKYIHADTPQGEGGGGVPDNFPELFRLALPAIR